jgi:hypothetical protein
VTLSEPSTLLTHYLLSSVTLASAGLVVQDAGLGLHTHFNHNDLCHVLLTAALWPFYRAGRAMGEKPGAASRYLRS